MAEDKVITYTGSGYPFQAELRPADLRAYLMSGHKDVSRHQHPGEPLDPSSILAALDEMPEGALVVAQEWDQS